MKEVLKSFWDSLKGPRIETMLEFKTPEGLFMRRTSSIRGWQNQKIWLTKMTDLEEKEKLDFSQIISSRFVMASYIECKIGPLFIRVPDTIIDAQRVAIAFLEMAKMWSFNDESSIKKDKSE